MTLSIAFSNTTTSQGHPAIARQMKARSRFLSRTARAYPIGCTVFVNGIEGRVLGYNIADFGRWLGVSHPILVKLTENRQVFHCKLSDLSNEPNHPAYF